MSDELDCDVVPLGGMGGGGGGPSKVGSGGGGGAAPEAARGCGDCGVWPDWTC